MSRKKTDRLPYMKHYTQDMRGEQTLKRCSWEARYIWREMLDFMHEAPERGFLMHANGDPMSEQDLASMIALDPTYSGSLIERIRSCLLELEMNGVFSRDRRKIIFNRRMVREAKKEATARQNGKNGGNPALKPGDKSEINRRYLGDKSDLESPITSDGKKEIRPLVNQNVVIPETRDQRLEEKRTDKSVPKKNTGTRLPEDWQLKAHLGNWALEQGLSREEVIRESDKFRNYWHSKPGAQGRKIDWDKTFKNWIYSHLERKPNHVQRSLSRSERADAASAEALAILDSQFPEPEPQLAINGPDPAIV